MSSASSVTRWSLRELAAMGSSGSGSLSSTNAHCLLQDVSLRLKEQQALCETLMDRVKELDETSLAPQNRIIPAVNHPVQLEWNRRFQQRQQSKHDMDKVKRELHNLQVLHADTFRLTFGLLHNANIWNRFSLPDRHLVAATMEQVRSRHAATVETLADVVIRLRGFHSENEQQKQQQQLDASLDSFLRGRLGVQFLCDHYVALNKGKLNGGIAVDCNVHEVVDDAISEAKHICDANLQIIPDVTAQVSIFTTVTLIRPWVHHALVELLKNAMASNVQAAAPNESQPPPISVEMEEDDAMLHLHIVDQGVGLQGPASLERAFGFALSSVNRRWDRLDEQQSYAMVRSPLQSLGVGLPLSRMMMQHFGGNVVLRNNETANGCTATIQLNKDDTYLEQLPYQRTDYDTDRMPVELEETIS